MVTGTGDGGLVLGANGSSGSFHADDDYNLFYNPAFVNDQADWAIIEKSNFTGAGLGGTAQGGFVTSLADVKFGGFNVVGSYYDGEALGILLFNLGSGDGFACNATDCDETDNDGWYVQGSYTFNGKTKVGVSYGESNQDDNAVGAPARDNTLWTVGVYHDVNSWLKVMAEYNNYQSDFLGIDEADNFSVGGFLLW